MSNFNFIYTTSSTQNSVGILTNNFNSLSGFVTIIVNGVGLCDYRIYGASKKDTKTLEKQNCKLVLKVYKRLVSLIKKLKHKKIKFSNTLNFICSNAKNNNAVIICDMLNLRFNTCIFKRQALAISKTCDYLDLENYQNNMCDFKDNLCFKARARGFSGTTGCCPKNCKRMKNGPCNTKNISCKIIMCDELEKKGYYYSPLYMPTLVANLNFAQLLASYGLFFKTERKVNFVLWLVRVLTWIINLIIIINIIKLLI